MKNTALNQKITLLKLRSGHGREPPEVVVSKRVWACVYDVGIQTRMTALSAGQMLTYAAEIYKNEFEEATHAEIDGARYKISQALTASNPLFLKLYLERD